MKTESSLINTKLVLSAIILTAMLLVSYYYSYTRIYRSMDVSFSEVSFIEYGKGNFNIKQLIDGIDGDRVVIRQGVDISRIGVQEIVLDVKRDGVVRQVTHEVEVKATIAPEIQIKEEIIQIYEGEEVAILNNIESVIDHVWGTLEHSENAEGVSFFTYSTDLNGNVPGTYNVKVKAVNSNNLVTEVTFQIVVNRRPVVEPVQPIVRTPAQNAYVPQRNNYNNNAVSSIDTSSLSSVAWSLVGSPYAWGGTSRAGFDCSGFVQYVFRQMGIHISRSSRTQIHDGVGVSIDSMRAGDIIVWSANGATPTHVSLYVGGGTMIHATNPRQGVIASNVWAWNSGSRDTIIAVRRI